VSPVLSVIPTAAIPAVFGFVVGAFAVIFSNHHRLTSPTDLRPTPKRWDGCEIYGSNDDVLEAWSIRPPTDTPAEVKALLKNISLVLCEPQGPQNVGGAARVLQNFGLSDLRVVAAPNGITEQQVLTRSGDPVQTEYRTEVRQFARTGGWIISNAEKEGAFQTTQEAIADCCLVVGTSVRRRGQGMPFLTPRKAAQRILEEAKTGRVAVLFGNERNGLTNDDLRLAHVCVYIPTQTINAEPSPTSLNLSHALAIMCYELYHEALGEEAISKLDSDVRRPEALLDTAGRQQLALELLEALQATSVVPTTGFTTPEEPPQEGQWEEALTRVWTVALERVLSVGPLERAHTKYLFALARRTSALGALGVLHDGQLPLARLLKIELQRAGERGELPKQPTPVEAREYLRREWDVNLTKRELEILVTP